MHRSQGLGLWVLPMALLFVPAQLHAQIRSPIRPVYRYALESDLRVNVKPKEASVYVDGYFAGKVEEFDGTFQRLHLEPGEHEIVVYLEGYRSLRQRLYLSPNKTRKIEGTLEKLAAGEARETPPQPSPPNARRNSESDRMLPGQARIPAPRPLPPPQRVPDSQLGTLSIRVQPSGATVFIDGERWAGPTGPDERLLVQVSEGRHRIEVEREGYERFVTEIEVRRTETAPVNISLTRTR